MTSFPHFGESAHPSHPQRPPILFTGAVVQCAFGVAVRSTREAVAPLSGSAMPSATATTSTDDRVPVDVNAATIQELGIRLEVGRSSLTQEARAVAMDESRISHVHTRVAGWVEQLDVNTTGELVTAGQPLGRISRRSCSRRRPSTWPRDGTPPRHLERGDRQWANAPHRARDGTRRNRRHRAERRTETAGDRRCPEERRRRESRPCTSVDPSTTLLTIADLSRVWVLAEVPEANIPGIRVGTLAHLDFPASGRQPFARVSTSSIRRSPTARARCASASRRPIRAAASGRACMERRP